MNMTKKSSIAPWMIAGACLAVGATATLMKRKTRDVSALANREADRCEKLLEALKSRVNDAKSAA